MPHLSRIQSIKNSMVKHAHSLRSGKAAGSEDFLCEGFHLAREAFESRLKFRFVFGTPSSWGKEEGQALLAAAQSAKVKCFEAPPNVLQYLSDTVTPQGLAAVVRKPDPLPIPVSGRPILALYRLQDPGNLGTLFRSAEAFGAAGLLLTDGCCDPFNPKVVRAAMGSLFRVPFRSGGNWASHQAWLKGNGFHPFALAAKAQRALTDPQLPPPLAFWLGSEGEGLPADLVQDCEGIVGIPMEGRVESLNAGIAGSLALFQAGVGMPGSGKGPLSPSP